MLSGNSFYSLSDTESKESKYRPALPRAWVPANAGTHTGLFHTYIRDTTSPYRHKKVFPKDTHVD